MKITNTIVLAAMTAATLFAGAAGAQTPIAVPAQNFYYDDTEWPLPNEDRISAFRLTGMTSVHAVMMSFARYSDGKPVTDSSVITLLEGMTTKWAAPQGGCGYELQLVNSNPPVINMSKPSAICNLRPGGKVIFRILALP